MKKLFEGFKNFVKEHYYDIIIAISILISFMYNPIETCLKLVVLAIVTIVIIAFAKILNYSVSYRNGSFYCIKKC